MGFVLKRRSNEVEIEYKNGVFVFQRPNERHRLAHLESLPAIILKFASMSAKEKTKFFQENEDRLRSWDVNFLGVKMSRAYELFITAKNLVDESGKELSLSKDEIWHSLDFETKSHLADKIHAYVTGSADEQAEGKV